MITESLSTLKINKLTQEQYDRELEAGNIDENALYLTPVDVLSIEEGGTGADTAEEALTNLGVADYPVEKGTTTDGYTYEKWNSGTFKMWGEVTFSYDSEEYLISPRISYPVRLSEPPLLFFSYDSSSSTLIDANNIGVPTTESMNTGSYATTQRIKYRDTAWVSSHTVTMGMYVIGKWK